MLGRGSALLFHLLLLREIRPEAAAEGLCGARGTRWTRDREEEASESAWPGARACRPESTSSQALSAKEAPPMSELILSPLLLGARLLCLVQRTPADSRSRTRSLQHSCATEALELLRFDPSAAMHMPESAMKHGGIEPRVAVIAAGTSRLRSVLKALLHSLP